MAATQGRLRRVLGSIAGTFSLDLGVVGVELTKGRRDRPDPAMLLRSLLQVLVRSAQRHDLLLVLDEFSSIAAVDGAAAILRTELQHHYHDLGIVFAGSQPSTMRTLFSDQAEPFFAQADLVEIGPLSRTAVAEIVERGFAQTGRDPDGITSLLVAMAAGHPQRAMQLADGLWWATGPKGVASDVTWEAALAGVRSSVDARLGSPVRPAARRAPEDAARGRRRRQRVRRGGRGARPRVRHGSRGRRGPARQRLPRAR